MTVIRVGEGQEKSGKILDSDTRWFELKDAEEAIRYAQDMNKKLVHHRKHCLIRY